MVSVTDRNKQKLELANSGYSMSYLDDWQPKTTLYRHKPSYDQSGNVVEDVGSTVKGVPGNPDYILKKAKIGLFGKKPGEDCECPWCEARNAKVDIDSLGGTDGEPPKESVECQQCGDTIEALTVSGAMSKLRAHIKTHDEVVTPA